MSYYLLAGGWILFSFLHSWLASEKCKAYIMSKMGQKAKYYRLIYSVFALVSLGAVLIFQFSIPASYFVIPPSVKNFVALPCIVLATVVMGICIRKYFYHLSGVEVLFQKPTSPVLETGGIHKIVRHPLYMGTLLLIWSLFLFFPSLANAIACIAITCYIVIGIHIEERKLVGLFGSQYENYRSRTPMLIPYRVFELIFRRILFY